MITLRITETMMSLVRSDLIREHPFAYERVGFLFLRQGSCDKGMLLIATSYSSVPDDQYIRDLTVGARINVNAIRNAMQRIMDTGEDVLHVHLHAQKGVPAFSQVDLDGLKQLIPSFQKVCLDGIHGAAVLSADNVSAIVWHPKEKSIFAVNKISIVGFPINIYERSAHARR